MEHLNGEMKPKGISGKTYEFKFGWKSYRIMCGLLDLKNLDVSNDEYIRILLLSGLMARKESNNLPDSFSKDDMFDLLDDLSEKQVTDAFQLGQYALGFTLRIVGASPEEVEKLAAAQEKSSKNQTGAKS